MVYGLAKIHGILPVSMNIKVHVRKYSDDKVLELGLTVTQKTFLSMSCGAHFLLSKLLKSFYGKCCV